MRFIATTFLMISIISSCHRYDDRNNDNRNNDNSVVFADSINEISELSRHYLIIREIFKTLDDSTDLAIQSIGYNIRDNKIFYRNCVGSRSDLSLDAENCNYDDFLSYDQEENLFNSITKLKDFNIKGCYYEHSLDDFILIENVIYSGYGDGRFYYYNEDSVVFNKNKFDVINKTENLYYFKDKL